MAEIRVKDNESLDSALRRFKRSCARSGVLAEVRKRVLSFPHSRCYNRAEPTERSVSPCRF